MRVEGPTAMEMALVFSESWERSGGEPLLMIFDENTSRTLAQAFEEDLRQSLEMRLESWNHRPLAHRLGDALARCLSPLF